MIQLGEDILLVEHPHELPDLSRAEELFHDIESVRVFDDKDYGGLYPFKGDLIAGVAVTADDDPRCWYVPVRHTPLGSKNIPVDGFRRWLADILRGPGDWINHNILLDASFTDSEGVECGRRLIDTLTLAKTHDTDRLEYGLKPLARDWLNLPMQEALEVKAYLDGIKSKSFADCPTDLLGKYACMDVKSNRMLWRYLVAARPQQLEGIWETEVAYTWILKDAERRGLQVNHAELKIDRLHGLRKLVDLSTEISELVGREFTNSNQCVYDILINQLGLPVLATKWEKDEDTGRLYDTGRPTFDKKAMALYVVHPQVLGNDRNKRVVDLLHEYRVEQQHQSLFTESFIKLKDSQDIIHPTYNQLVRTGRGSCKRPNIQQQTKRSKSLIHPKKGRCFLSADASQIEFRLIVHFINDLDAIAQYQENPKTDFHAYVAKICHMKRKAGKTMNFRIAYGAGKRNITSALATDPDIIEEVGQLIDARVRDGQLAEELRNGTFHDMCQQRASELYEFYHEKFPGIKRLTNDCAAVCRRRGFVFNPYGRRRHLPIKASHKAFNSLIQGCAMDIIKERMVATSSLYNQQMRDWDIHIVANVHDEVLYDAPVELMLNQEVHEYLLNTLQTPNKPFRVPIVFGLGVSSISWAEAAGDDTVFNHSGVPIAGKLR